MHALSRTVATMAWGTRRPETTSTYHGVLVPLDQAHRYSHSRKQGKTEYEEAPTVEDPDIEARLDSLASNSDDEDGLDAAKEESDNEAAGMLQMTAAEYTIEGLRNEMNQGQGGGPGGRWTTYESEFHAGPSEDGADVDSQIKVDKQSSTGHWHGEV